MTSCQIPVNQSPESHGSEIEVNPKKEPGAGTPGPLEKTELTNSHQNTSLHPVRQPLEPRLAKHTIPFLMALLQCSEEEAWTRPLTFQLFDDTSSKDSSKARIIHGCIDDLGQEFDDLNAQGVGIFLTPNETDLRGRTKGHVSMRRAWWSDLDEKDAQERFDLSLVPLRPTIVVRSGHGTHLYLIAKEPMPCQGDEDRKAAYESELKNIRSHLDPYGADPKVCQIAAVLRVPGFYNCKREPVFVELLHADGPTYTPEQINQAFPAPQGAIKTTRRPAPPVVTPPILEVFKRLGCRVKLVRALEDGVAYNTSCPWADTHTSGEDDLRQYLTVDTDSSPRAWVCHHASCNGRSLAEVLDLARTRGLEVPPTKHLSALPTIVVRPPEHEVVDASRRALGALPGVYTRQRTLVHVVHHPGTQDGKRSVPRGAPVIAMATAPWVRERLSKAAKFERHKTGKDGEIVVTSTLVPDWVPVMILAEPGPDCPELVAITETPVMLRDGSIHDVPGELRNGVLFLGPAGLPKVPLAPTLADARNAWKRLQALIEDFPFPEALRAAYEAAWLASALTIAGRYAFHGPAPFILLDANTAAAGKGLLVTCTVIITTGRDPAIIAAPRDQTELRKSILPVLVDGVRVQVWDEVGAEFTGQEWNALLTSTTWKGRILGTSQTVELPANTVHFCLGNNVPIAPDSVRRCLPIRLEPQVEHPEDRDDFSIPDLRGYVREHQAELLCDVLTILRAWHQAGRPASGLKPWGSFEGWSSLVRDATYWCTEVDPDCRIPLHEVADEAAQFHRQLLKEIRDTFGTVPFAVRDLIDKASEQKAPMLGSYSVLAHPGLHDALQSLAPHRDGLNPTAIGKRLRSLRNRTTDGLVLQLAPTKTGNGALLWRVIEQWTDAEQVVA